MRNLMSSKMAGAALAAILSAAAAGAAAPAQAQTLIPGVTGCGASGVKQERGALIGALAGGFLGNRIADGNRGVGTLLGAVAGGAAGSAVGCQMQKNDAQQVAYGGAGGYGAATYRHSGYRLYSGVAPASYTHIGHGLVTTQTVNVRAAPSAGSAKVGALSRGERFEALAQVRGTDWILVGQNGVGVGYVNGANVRAEGYRYASY